MTGTLRVADQKGLTRALLDASHALDGIGYRIVWSDFENAAPLLQALGADAVDTGIAGEGPFLFAFGAGLGVRATLAVLPRAGGHSVAIMVSAGSPVRTASDLAGRTVATTRGSIGHELLLKLEQRSDIPAGSLHVVALQPAQAAAALQSGRVDAWATWEPYVALAEAQGGRRVLDGAGLLANYAFQVSNLHAIATRRALLQDFYHRLARAYAWGNQHPDQYAAIWSQQVGMPAALSRRVTDEMRTRAGPITDAVVQAERETIGTYRTSEVLPANGQDVAGAFDRSFSP